MLKIPNGRSKQTLKVGTWNVNSLYESGKLENVIQEMVRLKIDILGISETWSAGESNTEDATFYYSGNQITHHNTGME